MKSFWIINVNFFGGIEILNEIFCVVYTRYKRKKKNCTLDRQKAKILKLALCRTIATSALLTLLISFLFLFYKVNWYTF